MNLKLKMWYLGIVCLVLLVCHNSLAQNNESPGRTPLPPTLEISPEAPILTGSQQKHVEKIVRIAQTQATTNGKTPATEPPSAFFWPADSAFQVNAKDDWKNVAPIDEDFHQWAIQYIPDIPRDATIYAESLSVRYCSMNVAKRPWMIRWLNDPLDKTLHRPTKMDLLYVQKIPDAQVDELLGAAALHGITQKHLLKDITLADSVLKILPINEKIKSRPWILERCTFDRQGKFVDLVFDASSTVHGNLSLKISVGVNGYLAQLSGLALENGLDAQDTPTELPPLPPPK